MPSTYTPFSRITILLNELKGTKLTELLDVTKCDLLYHTSKLSEEIEEPAHKEAADQVSLQGKNLVELLQSGDLIQAEAAHQTLIGSCKSLKNLL